MVDGLMGGPDRVERSVSLGLNASKTAPINTIFGTGNRETSTLHASDHG